MWEFVSQYWIELALFFLGIALLGWLLSPEKEDAPLEEVSEADLAIEEAERWLKECRSHIETDREGQS